MDLPELLKEALRDEVDRKPTIDVKRPSCELCGTRRTPTFPCKKCWPEDWKARYMLSREANKNKRG